MSEMDSIYSSTDESSIPLTERFSSKRTRKRKSAKLVSSKSAAQEGPPVGEVSDFVDITPATTARPSKVAAPGKIPDDDTRDSNVAVTKPAPTPTSSTRTTTTPTAPTASAPGPSGPPPNTTSSPKPPPIHIQEVGDFEGFCRALDALVGRDGFFCKARMHEIMITPSTPDAYRKIIKYLTEGKYAFHTYQIKTDRAYRVVFRGLHHRTPVLEITRDVEEQGHKVRGVTNALHPRSKMPLPLFFVDLEPAPNNSDVFNIHRIFYTEVRVEEPHKRSDIVQCTRCQQFRHTKSYCNRPPRCVRCAGEHDSSTCSKSRETPATCALCGNNHPANYRGCQVYKALQKATTNFKKNANTQEKRSDEPPSARVSAVVAGASCPATAPGVAAGPSKPHQLPRSTSALGVQGPHPEPQLINSRPPLAMASTSYSHVASSNAKTLSKHSDAPQRITLPQARPVPLVPTAPVPFAEFLASFFHEFKSLAEGLVTAIHSISSLIGSLAQHPAFTYQYGD
ncbi:hypothetical protein AAG570_001320 [Ranatra chinensis]|uniref:Pre-C2HC domain-containing protein n=1 Tax=Ranatra chinensis TaxID=642074 RepID=A0ABD0YBJ0_9HEMI